MTIQDLQAAECADYYQRYINKLSNDKDLLSCFTEGKVNVISFFSNISPSKWDFAYDEDKWTIKEVLQHLIDTERVFSYRCFRIARADNTPLAGFDQNTYIEPSGASAKTSAQLLAEFEYNRNHSISLIQSLSDDALKRMGVASEVNMSARACAFTIVGHDIWHMDIIKERYL